MQKNWVHEAVFRFKEAGLKLDVTTWVPRFMQSVIVKECVAVFIELYRNTVTVSCVGYNLLSD